MQDRFDHSAPGVVSGAAPADRLLALHLEDDPLDAQLIAATLDEAGLAIEIDRVSTREGFVGALSARAYDVILCDYNVPGFGGGEALLTARKTHPDLPFLFVSGALGEHMAIDLLKQGATDYVLKDRLDRLAPSIDRARRESREKRERLAAEEKLQARERTLSTLMRNLPGMVFRTRRGGDWRFEFFASEGCLPLTGYPPETFTRAGAMSWEKIVHPDDARRIREEAITAFSDGGPFTTTYRITTRAGEERWVWARSVLVVDEAGSRWVEGFVTDITLQKRAESEIARRTEFEQQLIGIVSHDLRGPLQTITLGANALLRREVADETTTKVARRILSSAERATRMIRDLLDFTQARLGGGLSVAPQHIELASIAASVVEELESHRPERRIALSTEPVEGLWDPDRIAQVLGNLVGNALTYSPAESVVSVRVASDGDHAILEVHNLGEPIPPERLAEIWKPLTRGVGRIDTRTRSIGLGLFIVERIVAAHGGAVAVRSSHEDGTTFSVRLPVQRSNGAEAGSR